MGIVAVFILVIAVLVYTNTLLETAALIKRSFYLMETRRDTQRVHGLREVKKTVEEFYEKKGVLPESLTVLVSKSRGDFSLMLDPVSQEPYDYRVGSEREIQALRDPQPIFEICTNFEAPSPLIWKDITPPCPQGGLCEMAIRYQVINPIEPEDEDTEFWDHAIGYGCWMFGSDGRFLSGFRGD